MPTPPEEQLIRLCHRREVLARAQALYHTLRTKTGPGTGYDLGQGAPGLPSICAFLASEALNFPDITYNLGQIASCLSPKVWSASINIARAALASSLTELPSVKRGRPAIMYRTLITQNKIGRVQRVMHWMDDAQQLLLDSPQFNREYKLAPECMEVKITVFLWVCRILKLKHVDPDAIIKERKVTQKVFNGLTKVLDDCCWKLQLRINSTVQALRENAAGRQKKSQEASAAGDVEPGDDPESESAGEPTDVAEHASTAGPSSSSKDNDSTPPADTVISVSPSNSALRDTTSAPSSKPQKRKVVLGPAHAARQAIRARVARAALRKEEEEEEEREEAEDVVDVEMAESPAKKRKLSESSPLPMSNNAYTYPMPPPPGETVASSSKVTLDGAKSKPHALAPSRTYRASSPPMRSLLDDGGSAHGYPIPRSPSTARRGLQKQNDTALHAHRTPQSSRRTLASVALLSDDDDLDDYEEEEDTYPTMRRFRPVLVDCKQWGQRAPKLEKQHAAAERSKRAMVARWGHPFDWMKRAEDASYERRGDS